MRTFRTFIFNVGVCVLGAAPPADAQESARADRSRRRPPLARAEEVALARSAAPKSVSDSATVYVLTDTGYVVAARGPAGTACCVGRELNAQGRLELGEQLSPAAAQLPEPMGTAPAVRGAPRLTGFFVIRASDLEAATAISRTCPHLKYGGMIVVRPIVAT